MHLKFLIEKLWFNNDDGICLILHIKFFSWYTQSPGITKIEKYYNTMNYITEYYAYLINAVSITIP